jgi:hypothetical protein
MSSALNAFLTGVLGILTGYALSRDGETHWIGLATIFFSLGFFILSVHEWFNRHRLLRVQIPYFMNSQSEIQSFIRITNVWEKAGEFSVNVFRADLSKNLARLESMPIGPRQTLQLSASTLEQQSVPPVQPIPGNQYMLIIEGNFVGEAVHLHFNSKGGGVTNLGGVIDLNNQ